MMNDIIAHVWLGDRYNEKRGEVELKFSESFNKNVLCVSLKTLAMGKLPML